METQDFVNTSDTGEIPSFNGSEKAKATDFANYFCSYAELHHQKQMLADHNRMAAYHSAILGNASVFKDKIVMDVGTVRISLILSTRNCIFYAHSGSYKRGFFFHNQTILFNIL